jgi:diaminohydroxyphosphoribosylaminopyrimidine deaminase/5-amino-6-(5-phosphoribosylamino)uracil reductase
MMAESDFSLQDKQYMSRAMELASKAPYTTTPNPKVGCVLVADGNIIGEGYHHKAGMAHAEVNAIQSVFDAYPMQEAKSLLAQSMAYVTLEPCSYFGQTPPCCDLLIKHNIPHVVVGMVDPNPKVAGRGVDRLISSGISVRVGCLESSLKALNSGFIKKMQQGLPFVRIKQAMSLDGRTAMKSGESKWITGSPARKDVQILRAMSCAIIFGSESIKIDNPSMTVREEELGQSVSRQPLRVLIDSQEQIGSEAKLYSQKGDICIVGVQDRQKKIKRSKDLGEVFYATCPSKEGGRVDVLLLLQYLVGLGCQDILVESGPTLSGVFVEQGLVDELIVYCAPTLLGSNANPLFYLPIGDMSKQIRWKWKSVRMIGNDLKLTLQPLIK